MDPNGVLGQQRQKGNQNIQVYVRIRPLNAPERVTNSLDVIDLPSNKELVVRKSLDTKLTKKFTFDKVFGPDSEQTEVYASVVAPLIKEILAGYSCTVFAYGQAGTGKTFTMIGDEDFSAPISSRLSINTVESMNGIIPKSVHHLFDELRMMEVEFSMHISYLKIDNEELCDLLSSDDTTKIRIFDDVNKKGSVILQGLEEIPVHNKNDVFKLLTKSHERRKTAVTLMNAQSSRSHTVFSILVHIKENGVDGEDMLKTGKLYLVDLAGSENVSKAGNEGKGARTKKAVNINQSLLTLGRVITALTERTPYVPYHKSKLTRMLQESLGGRTKTSIIATISPGQKDIKETLNTLEYASRSKNIQNRPEINQRLTKKTILKEYTEEIDKLKRDLKAAGDKNKINLAQKRFHYMESQVENQNKKLTQFTLKIKALEEEMARKLSLFKSVKLNLIEKSEQLEVTEVERLERTSSKLVNTKKVLSLAERDCLEKKIELDSQKKTEETLTAQAQQLLSIADSASSETEKLQDTIERRKMIGEEKKSNCDDFATTIQANAELVKTNLSRMEKTLAAKTVEITDEIDKTAKDFDLFCMSVTVHIKKMVDMIYESVLSLKSCFKMFETRAKAWPSQQQAEIQLMIEEMMSSLMECTESVIKMLDEHYENITFERQLMDQCCMNGIKTAKNNEALLKKLLHELDLNLHDIESKLNIHLQSNSILLRKAITNLNRAKTKNKKFMDDFEKQFALFLAETREILDVNEEYKTIGTFNKSRTLGDSQFEEIFCGIIVCDEKCTENSMGVKVFFHDYIDNAYKAIENLKEKLSLGEKLFRK